MSVAAGAGAADVDRGRRHTRAPDREIRPPRPAPPRTPRTPQTPPGGHLSRFTRGSSNFQPQLIY